ncbi:MAG: hypothetical protein DYH05_09460 [Acidobacteria bacterium ACB1]|nr:hypothetical protein [Acidobacteria bacterium ACB1]RIJ90420.1 MAG: hypothetical protein DCC44_10610 [Acidobacteriota bacterium]
MSVVHSEQYLNERPAAAIAGRFSQASKRAEELAFWSFIITIAIFGYLQGNVGDPSRSLLAFLLCFSCFLRTLSSLLSGSFRVADPVLILPLVGIVGVAVLQILPFRSGPISADPFETKAFIVFFSALILAGESLRHLTNNPRRLRILVGTVIVVGSCSAVYGIVLSFLFEPNEQYAQFANRNHYAVLAEMATGLLIGLLTKGQLPRIYRFAGLLCSAIIIYSLLTAGSRGGLISLIAMLVFSVIAHTFFSTSIAGTASIGPPLKMKILGAVSACVLIVIVSVAAIGLVGGNTVVTRFEQVRDEVESQSDTRLNRGTIWNITLELIQERPALGAGFGAYAAAITPFDHSNGTWPLEQAHSEYLEILANGGIVSFVFFGIFLILVARRVLPGLRARDRLERATCFGATVGIFGVLVHSLVDFGLHVPLNAIVFVVLLVVATNGSNQESPNPIQ